MIHLRPFLMLLILTFLSVLMCGVTSVLGASHPLFMLLSMMGGTLGTLIVMDYIDAAFLH